MLHARSVPHWSIFGSYGRSVPRCVATRFVLFDVESFSGCLVFSLFFSLSVLFFVGKVAFRYHYFLVCWKNVVYPPFRSYSSLSLSFHHLSTPYEIMAHPSPYGLDHYYPLKTFFVKFQISIIKPNLLSSVLTPHPYSLLHLSQAWLPPPSPSSFHKCWSFSRALFSSFHSRFFSSNIWSC